MGDPASIRFWTNTQDEHPISLYLHWGAGSFAKDLAGALEATDSRWDDEDYATRMAIQAVLLAQEITFDSLGAGLYVGTADAGGPVLNVNWADQRVWSDEWTMRFQDFILNRENIWEKVQS